MIPVARRLAVACGVLICIPAVILDWYGGRQTEGNVKGKWDVIIVLGAAVWRRDDRWIPCPTLQRRTRVAIRMYQDGVAPLVIFTGGRSSPQIPSESSVARDWAIAELGILEKDTIIEEMSKTTEQNIAGALNARHWPESSRFILVSDSYHIFRARRMLIVQSRRQGTVAAVGSRPAASVRVKGAVREVFALAKAVAVGNVF